MAGAIERRVAPGGVYLGVGPDQNFTYIAHARPDLSLIVDYRRRNALLHLLHKALFGLALPLSYSGTGILLLAVFLPLVVLHRRAVDAAGGVVLDEVVAENRARVMY